MSCRSGKDFFSVIRDILAFRRIGSNIDQLVIASDAGRIVFLEYEISGE
jgi:hypothetical protein